MQQVALPSVYAPRKRAVPTPPFPLVRPRHEKTRPGGTRKFVAGLLFGVLMSATLALLGYAARVFFDENPGTWRAAVHAIKTFDF